MATTQYRVLTSPTDDGRSAHVVNAKGENLAAGAVVTAADLHAGVHMPGLVTSGHLEEIEAPAPTPGGDG